MTYPSLSQHTRVDIVFQDFDELPADAFDCVIDCVGESIQCMDVVERGGKIVSIADTPPRGGLLGLQRLGVSVNCCMGVVLDCLSQNVAKKARLRGIEYSYQCCSSTGGETLHQIAKYYEQNLLTPVLDSVYAFDDWKEAIEHIESGDYIGKIVVQVFDIDTIQQAESDKIFHSYSMP